MPRPSNGGGRGWSGAINSFAALIMTLSNGWRALVLIAIAAIAGGLVYEKYVASNSDGSTKNGGATNQGAATADAAEARSNRNGAVHASDPWTSGAPYTSGGIADPSHPGADNSNPQNLEAADKSSEDQAALSWHFVHKSDDDPEEIAIDGPLQVFYRYFAKTDHCVFVRRRIGDSDQSQWVRDPNFHFHDIHRQPHRGALDASPRGPGVTGAVLDSWLAMFFPALQASATEPIGTPPAGSQFQTTCLNPHPGRFRYWWGPPLDQCNSPMYRQFADGCTHYQIYNRCANAWDSRITWTKCVAQHSR